MLFLPFSAGRKVGQMLGCLLGLLALSGPAAWAQEVASHCLLLPMEPARRAQQSMLVVEAEVRDASSFWNAAHTRLFTRHRLRVFSLLKGAVADTTGLVLITEGGQLGLAQQLLTNTLQLQAGQQGVLFLHRAPWSGLPDNTGPSWAVFGSEQGFIEYQLSDGTAAEPFRNYPAVDADFYQEITRLTGQPRRVLQANLALQAAQAGGQRRTAAASITSILPTSLAAGVGAVLTITGEDFGSTRGSGFIEFRNADDGGTTWIKARENDYLTWTNTRIQVRVPSSGGGGHPAGSGKVRVTTSGAAQAESPGALTIVYALTNVENTTGTILQRPNHVALNGAGGIDFHFGANFSPNTAAMAAWLRALTNWRCHTGVNWQATTPAATSTIAADGQNIIAFDTPADELPDRVLGRTTSYYQGCYGTDGRVAFYVSEIDMQFDSGSNFQFGPAVASRTQVDFETVAVHELGHAQQLNHLNLPGAVMHYGIAIGQTTRTLNPLSDITGGRRVLRERSFLALGCGGPAMLPAPLTSSDIEVASTGVALRWTTQNECFLISFVIERSPAADTSTWETVATVPASTTGQYAFTDAQPLAGLHYYRLRLRRPDGSLDSTAPVPISTGEANPGVALFPNPVVDNLLRLQYPAPAEGTLRFEIYDELGRLVGTSFNGVQAGLNVLSIDATGLKQGFYILRWRGAPAQEGSRRFVRL